VHTALNATLLPMRRDWVGEESGLLQLDKHLVEVGSIDPCRCGLQGADRRSANTWHQGGNGCRESQRGYVTAQVADDFARSVRAI
jgi:hypothetical protein